MYHNSNGARLYNGIFLVSYFAVKILRYYFVYLNIKDSDSSIKNTIFKNMTFISRNKLSFQNLETFTQFKQIIMVSARRAFKD